METENKQPQPTDEKAIAFDRHVICRCPVCKSENITESDFETVFDMTLINPKILGRIFVQSCKDCGIIFKKVRGNGI